MGAPDLPSGTVTYLFTDVAGSTRLWEQAPTETADAMVRHDRIVDLGVADHAGRVVRPRGEGDSRFAVFGTASDAVGAAVEIQQRMAAEPWPTPEPLRLRIAVHTGEAVVRDGDFYGEAVNRCARLRGIAHPGQVLVSGAAASVAGSVGLGEGVGLEDLGVHRLKDLSRPEHVFQAIHPALQTDFPPLLSLDRARHNLPVRLSRLIGREDDVRLARKLLAERRLVTVTGFGGVGKTRLALQVAAELADGGADGVWFADLSSATEADGAASVLGGVLGAGEAADGPRAAVLRRLAGRNLLLVLDNLEQIDGIAGFVAELLAAAPDVTVLATSRQRLGISGEQEFPLAALDTDESGPAVQLFAERAAEADPRFVLGPGAYAVAAICRRLEGHPLSIELAAARAKVLPPAALLARLDEALSVLADGSGLRAGRHRTLQATIAWSYDLLPAGEQLLLDCLSVFSGPATFEAVDRVCGGDVLDRLDSLAAKSLVETVEPASNETEVRFRLLVSVRAFARERLAARGLAGEIADRHADFYAWLQRERFDQSPDDLQAALGAVERDLDNVRQAHARSCERLDPGEAAVFVSGDFAQVLVESGHLAELRTVCGQLVARPGAPLAALASARFYLSLESFLNNRRDVAREVAAAGLADAEAAGRPDLALQLRSMEVYVAEREDDVRAAVAALDRALAAVPPAGNHPPRWAAEVTVSSALMAVTRWLDPDRALRLAEDRAGIPGLAATEPWSTEDGLGRLLLDRGRVAEAERVLRPIADDVAVRRDTSFPGPFLRFDASLQLSRLALAQDDLTEAWRFAELAVERADAFGSAAWRVLGRQQLAECAWYAGDLERAAGHLSAARALARDADPAYLGGVEWRLARVLRLSGRPDLAALASAARALAGRQAQLLLDVLGCLVEQAVAAADPAAAADLAGLVEAHRRDFVLPLGVAADLPGLLEGLRAVLGPELQRRLAAACDRPLPEAPAP